MIDGHKVVQLTLGYCDATVFDDSRQRLVDKWTPFLVDEKWVTLNKYPLPSVEENEHALIASADYHGYRTWDSGGDLGPQGAINYWLENHPQPPGTLLLGIDPDSCTQDEGFDKALCEVILANEGVAWCSLGIPETHSDDPNVRVIAGHRVFVHPSMMMFNISAYSLDWLPRLDSPTQYWGGIEQFIYTRLVETGTHIGYLMDYREDFSLRDKHDTRYATWKWEHYYGRFPGSFAEYLEVEKST